MNSYERVMNRFEGKPVDRLPNFSLVMMFAAKQLGVSYGEYADYVTWGCWLSCSPSQRCGRYRYVCIHADAMPLADRAAGGERDFADAGGIP